MEQLALRCSFAQEVDLLVRANGFEIEEKFSDFERKRFASGGMKQVVVCRKRVQRGVRHLFGSRR